jgi:6-pyruvoyltetrahydropterin/6-carboxytetrahydropterin synthase
MYVLNYENKFDAAHFLPNHPGKCKNLHGHTWKVRIKIVADELNKDGMIIDFHELKKIVNEFDHDSINNTLKNPTAENLAKHFFEKVIGAVKDIKGSSVEVEVWESEKSSIKYFED